MKRKIKRLKRGGACRNIVKIHQANFTSALRQAKQNYFQYSQPNFLRDSPHKFWKFLSKKKKTITRISCQGVQLADKSQISEAFNKYFQSVFSHHGLFVQPSTMSPNTTPDIVSSSGVFSMLLNLKTKASAGPDGIPNIFLRRYAEAITEFLVVIFRKSFETGNIPSDWRKARIVPVLKKGDPALIANYRPISITSTCCKLAEHIIANYITTFLNDNKVLTPHQHGFRKGFSTVTQLTSVIHTFASVLNSAGQMDVIFLDFSKAFDVISHAKLIYKLELIGLPNFIIRWISSYLSHRTQFVCIDDCYSNHLPVTSGVPQGSVLGPLLFLIYINDITNVITTPVQIRLFADDCVLFHQITCQDDQVLLNSNLQNIHTWCNKWDMKLNLEKTVYMTITNKKASFSFPYNISSHLLTEVSEYKYLGVTITKNLSWNKHVSNVCSSAFRKLCFLRHKLKLAPPELKKLTYFSIIRPSLEYACTVWDPYTKRNIEALEMIQRKAVRFIFSKYRVTDSPTTLMQTHGIETLQLRRKIQRLKLLFLLKNHKLSMNADPFLKPNTTRQTRNHHTQSLTPYSARINAFKYSFFPRTIEEWNRCSPDLLTRADSFDSMFSSQHLI